MCRAYISHLQHHIHKKHKFAVLKTTLCYKKLTIRVLFYKKNKTSTQIKASSSSLVMAHHWFPEVGNDGTTRGDISEEWKRRSLSGDNMADGLSNLQLEMEFSWQCLTSMKDWIPSMTHTGGLQVQSYIVEMKASQGHIRPRLRKKKKIICCTTVAKRSCVMRFDLKSYEKGLRIRDLA